MLTRRKKGFTLIEMMVVIAVIAILVSIAVPVVGGHLTKANAASNAANLRTVKGQVSTMYMQGQINFITSQADEQLISMVDGWKLNKYNPLAIVWNPIVESIKSAIKAGGEATDRYNNTYYGSDGIIDIDGVKVTAPVSKAVKVDELNFRSGTEMTVTITPTDIIVTYGGISTEIFALIAEHGDDAVVKMDEVAHTYIDSNGDSVCDVCNGKTDHSIRDQISGSIDNALGGAHTCVDSDKNCICDDKNCGMKIPCNDGWDSDHNCDTCGTCQHQDVTGWREDPDGVCNYCQQEM